MRIIKGLVTGAVALFILVSPGAAAFMPSNVYVVDTVTNLRNATFGLGTGGTTIFLQGYGSPGDGGGGTLATMAGASGICMTATGTITNTLNTIKFTTPLPVGLAPGMKITSPTTMSIQAGTTVSYFSVANQTITMSLPAQATGSRTIQFSGDTGGSTFVDNLGNGNCYVRVNPTFSQKEWGAVSDYSGPTHATDDTTALQKWLNANQPHIAVAGNSMITSPLTCGATSDVGIIQGSPTQAVAEDSSLLPTFQITANNSGHLLDNSAMLIMAEFLPDGVTPVRCAIHGVGLIGEGLGAYDIVQATGKSDLIGSHSYLSGGCYNVKTISPGANLEIYDSSLNNSYSDNARIGSPNVKLVRNSFAGAGTGYDPNNLGQTCAGHTTETVSGNNIYFSGSDIVIADNIIQQARGWGISTKAARLMRITGNYFDNNGKGIPATGAIDIYNSSTLSICDNTFHRSGAASEIAMGVSSHIYFEGSNDSVSMCGNVYLPGLTAGDNSPKASPVAIRPDYVYDADPSAALTNIAIADNPAPQNIGVMSTNAQTLLASSLNPQATKNYLSGLTLANQTGAASAVVSIGAGEASDSTGSTIIKSGGCTVDLGLSGGGLGGLDVSGGPSNFTTYYYFVVSGANGANPSCMASASLTPSFENVTSHQILQTGYATNNSPILFNVGQDSLTPYSDSLPSNPLAGMAIHDFVTNASSIIPSGDTISALNSFYASYGPSNVKPMTMGNSEVDFTSGTSLTGIAPNMIVYGTDTSVPTGIISNGTLVNTICIASGSCIGVSGTCAGTYPCILLSSGPTASCTLCSIAFGGNFTVTLNSNTCLSCTCGAYD